MTTPLLTQRRLNRTLLVRQCLVSRLKASPPRVLERVAGLQTQYSLSGYIGLWSRSEMPDRHVLTRQLERGRVVQATLFRSTIHMVSARDYPVWLTAVDDARRAWWTRVVRLPDNTSHDVADAVTLVERLLAEGPRHRRELQAALRDAGFPKEIWGGVELWTALVRVPPSGTWERRRADIYDRADRWLDMPSLDVTGAQVELVRRYIQAYGPTTTDSIGSWTGIPRQRVEEVIERLVVRHFESETGEPLIDLPRLPLPPEDIEVPVRFLPKYDDTLLVHARRTGIIREEHRPLVFSTKMPQSIETFTVDGVVAGTWKWQNGTIVTSPFEPLARKWSRALDEEARALAAFHRD